MTMKLTTPIVTLKGEKYPMSFPTKTDIEACKKKDGSPLLQTDLPVETVSNVLLNCLANYTVETKKEVFLVQHAAAWVLSPDKEPTQQVLSFILDSVLPESTSRYVETDGKKEKAGIYSAWVMAQVYQALTGKTPSQLLSESQ